MARTWNDNEPRLVAIRWTPSARPGRFTIAGFVEQQANGKTVATDQPRDYDVEYWGDVTPTKTVQRPWAYLIPTGSHSKDVLENLQLHGISLESLREPAELDVEVYQVNKFDRDPQEFQKHRLASLSVTQKTAKRQVAAGTIVVKTTQPLAALIVTLLEPESQDGLATWNYFDEVLGEPGTKEPLFTIYRLPRHQPLITSPYTAP